MYKKWLKYFSFISILLIVILELNYQYNRKSFFRTGLDYKVYTYLNQKLSKDVKTVIFSTSVTYGPLRKYKLRDDILDLSTVSSVGILGQYFMLKRYLEQNKNTVKNIYLFALPGTFSSSYEKNNPMYIDSVFDTKNEKDYLEKIRNKRYNPDYFYSRINYLKIWKSTYRKFSKKQLILKRSIDLHPYSGKSQINLKHQKITSSFNNVFDDFLNLCYQYNIKLYIVIEPLNSHNYQSYKNSDLSTYITSKNVTLINFNDIHTFKDDDFRDGRHLNIIKQVEYVYLINRYVVNILKDKKLNETK